MFTGVRGSALLCSRIQVDGGRGSLIGGLWSDSQFTPSMQSSSTLAYGQMCFVRSFQKRTKRLMIRCKVLQRDAQADSGSDRKKNQDFGRSARYQICPSVRRVGPRTRNLALFVSLASHTSHAGDAPRNSASGEESQAKKSQSPRPIIEYLDYLAKQTTNGGVVPVSYLELRRSVSERDEAD